MYVNNNFELSAMSFSEMSKINSDKTVRFETHDKNSFYDNLL